MAGYKLEVPVDISEKASDKLELARKIILLIAGVTTLLTICVDAPLIATEAKYEGGGAPGPNYTLFVAIISFAVPFILVYFPWMYEKHNKFRRGGKFFMKGRTNLIFCGFNSVLWATAGIAITVHANNAGTCTVNGELQETYGDDYTSAWATACNLAKVSAGFTWITCILWLTALGITGIHFWKESSMIQQQLNEHKLSKQSQLEERRKQQEDEESQYYNENQGHVNHGGRLYEEDHHEESPFADPYPTHQHQSPFMDYNPAYDGHTPGQYATPGFSPMPTPQQHMSHPEPSYYNNNNNQHF